MIVDVPLTEFDSVPRPPLSLSDAIVSLGNRNRVDENQVLTYEQALDRDPEWALREGSRHFDENSTVFHALRRIAKRLNEMGVPYTVVGGMALFRHGYRRFTEDVDILVNDESLETIHDKLVGVGYQLPHEHGKHLRETESGVKIEFLISGGFPGDRKCKPITIPDPAQVSFDADGIWYIKLEHLIELKVASGMTDVHRLRDLADISALIKTLQLKSDFAPRLHPYVRAKFLELELLARINYVKKWKLVADIDSRNLLDAMLQDGVVLDEGTFSDGSARLLTTDSEVARKYDMIDESEYWDRA